MGGRQSLARIGLALLVGGAIATEASGQAFGGRDVERGVTVPTRPRPEFDPLGVRLGGFRLDAALQAGVGWDSNVFGRRGNQVSDGYATQRLDASLNSLWSTHALGFSADLEARQQFSRSELDWTDWSIGGFGRYDFSVDTSVRAEYRHYRAHLDVYDFDVQRAGVFRPVPYDSDEISVSGTTRLNRIGLLAIGTYRTFRFEDVGGQGPFSRVSTNDFDTVIGALGTSYFFAPGRAANLVVRLQDISYRDSIARGRDSFTWEALAGLQYDFDGVWQARLSIGWRERDYRAPQFRNLSGPAVEGSLTWAPTLITTLRLAVASTIEESIRQDSVGYRRYNGSLTIDHELLRNVILTGQARLERREYERPTQTVTDGVLTLGANWLINRNLALIGSYSHYNRLSASGGISEWDRNLLQVRLRIAL
ncbi:outer membrane beta-barrel protein [Crenalkalicoccus roseus]|uniref:outer membrane beta-barrel protein n=1 Tax=Crenalkalicoccus roseus TaxID=1485588 RepID=UPI00108215F4|nr:outer membrane beta-barrel protein [Crenalkalicoccus roseus]